MGWDYKREESQTFKPIPEGSYRIRIKSAEKAVSSKGNDMLTLQFEVSGYNSLLFHHIVFLTEHPEITNGKLTQFFDSFKDIEDGNFDMKTWIGKVGACKVKHEEYNGDMQAKISYFIKADKQGDLPAWEEPQKKADSEFMDVPKDSGDLPF